MQPFFLPGAAGPLFNQLYSPRETVSGTAVLLVPPFAEELNKSRRMLALLGRALSRRGVSLLIPDLFGTGDSGGDFVESRWELWLDDLGRCAEWLETEGVTHLSLLGVRLGVLLALDFAQRLEPACDKLLFWQPVLSGKQALNQFLRLRIASGLFAGNDKETTASLRQLLQSGESIEVAGYELAPELAFALETKGLDRIQPRVANSIVWLELASRPGRAASSPAKHLMGTWQGEGIAVAFESLVGDPFWATQEITEASALIEASCRHLAVDA